MPAIRSFEQLKGDLSRAFPGLSPQLQSIATFALDLTGVPDDRLVLLVAVIFIVVNLFVDVLYGFLDPRIRLS